MHSETGMSSDAHKTGSARYGALSYPFLSKNHNPHAPMTETTFIAELPDGSFQPCYSPSSVVKNYFRAGQELPACEFVRLSRIALTEASGPVLQKSGSSSTVAHSSLSDIERWAGALPPTTVLTILHIH
jgi:uncharacterized repeat protein (TIGR04042 family)